MAQLRTAGLKLHVLEDREVLMNFTDAPVIDIATGTFMEGWHSAGLEPNDSTHGETRNVDSNKTNLTGGQTVTAYTAGDVTGSVDLIEGSPVVDYIEWPDTVAQDGVLYRKHTNEVAQATVARVYKYQSGIVKIKVSREKAGLTVAERGSATDPTPRALAIDYANGGDEVMFEEVLYHVGEDGNAVPVEKKVFQNVADVETELANGTAFVPQASESGLTAYTVVQDPEGLVEFTEPEETDPETP